MRSVRGSFVEHFGEDQAALLESAANQHDNEIHPNRGSDPFKWACLICIGYDCVKRCAEYHGLSVDPEEFRTWCVEHGELASHDGDCDFLSLATGEYASFVKMEEAPDA
jgi:hypothetical protein